MSTIGVIGTPPMKATARTIAHITIADPRSPCTRHAPAAQAATRAIGRRLRRTSASTSWRRTSRSAQNSTSASLRNSDGCTLNEPTVTHARASLMVGADRRHERQGHPDGRQGGERDRQPAHPRQVHAHGDQHPDEPEAGPGDLPAEDVVRAVALRRLDGRRRRQHHHQTEHHEHGDDDADDVVGGGRRAALDVPHRRPWLLLAPVVALRRAPAPCRRAAARAPAAADRRRADVPGHRDGHRGALLRVALGRDGGSRRPCAG